MEHTVFEIGIVTKDDLVNSLMYIDYLIQEAGYATESFYKYEGVGLTVGDVQESMRRDLKALVTGEIKEGYIIVCIGSCYKDIVDDAGAFAGKAWLRKKELYKPDCEEPLIEE